MDKRIPVFNHPLDLTLCDSYKIPKAKDWSEILNSDAVEGVILMTEGTW